MIADLKYAWRQLRRNPGFAIFAVLTLALGIGANTVIFNAVDKLLLSALPVKDPQQLLFLTNPEFRGMGTGERSGGNREALTYPEYRYLSENNRVFSGVLGVSAYDLRPDITADYPGQPLTIAATSVSMVSDNYFSVLGVGISPGRTFAAPESAEPTDIPVAVISYQLWQNRFRSDPAILTHKIRINGTWFDIVGVAQPGFLGETRGEAAAVWIPLALEPRVENGQDNISVEKNPLFKTFWIEAIGRLKPGVGVPQTKASINVTFQQYLRAQSGELSKNEQANFLDEHIALEEGGRGGSTLTNETKPIVMLMILVGLLLLIACSNLGALLYARATFRQREIAIRLAIGAKPARIFRQLLTESLMLSLIGGAVGLLLACWGDRILQKMLMPSVPLTVTFPILSFALLVSLATGVFFGTAPALRTLRLDLNPILKGPMSGASSSHRPTLGNLLVIGQISFSLVLLITAGLFIHSFRRLLAVDPGFDHDHLVRFNASLATAKDKNPAAWAEYQVVSDRILAMPGVRAVTYSSNGLFGGPDFGDSIAIDGFSPKSGEDMDANFDYIGPNYFSTMGIPILLGREIGPQDQNSTGQRVGVINRTMARYYFGDSNPIGRRVRDTYQPAGGANFIVIGVADDAKYHSLRDEPERRFYVPISHPIFEITWRPTFEVRTSGDPTSVALSIRAVLKKSFPDLKMGNPMTMNAVLGNTLSLDRLLIRFSACFGVLAAILASVGIYGIMSYGVARRTREIGIRIALGARRENVLWLILRESIVLALIGISIGIPAAIAGSKFAASLFFGFELADPAPLIVGGALILIVALIAGYFPARLATRVDPLIALRTE